MFKELLSYISDLISGDIFSHVYRQAHSQERIVCMRGWDLICVVAGGRQRMVG